MYELEGMGIRIQARRKELGLTQGEFADQLNISPQAVSKWETGLGMPDISSLPDIARVLDMSIDELFGRNVPKEEKSKSYPEIFEDLHFITAYGDSALYADRALQVDTMEANRVRFSDGSEVDLNTRRIYNRGIYSIRLVDEQLLRNLPEKKESQKSELPPDQEVKNLRLDLSSNSYDIEIHQTDGPVYWETETRENVDIKLQGDELVVSSSGVGKRLFSINFGSSTAERIRLYLPPKMQRLTYKSGGSGDLRSRVDFEEANLIILGSGDLDFNQVDHLTLDLKGAGDVRIRRVGSLFVDIAGAGDVDVEEIYKTFSGRLRGAGDIHLGSGEVEKLKLTITGAGDVNASHVTAEELDVAIHGPGSLVLGRLRGSSTESISFMGTLKILKRG